MEFTKEDIKNMKKERMRLKEEYNQYLTKCPAKRKAYLDLMEIEKQFLLIKKVSKSKKKI